MAAVDGIQRRKKDNETFSPQDDSQLAKGLHQL